MSTGIGKRMLEGGCVKYHSTAGNGVVRNIAFAVVGRVGNALVNKLSEGV